MIATTTRLAGGRTRLALRFKGKPRELYLRRWTSAVGGYRGPYRSPRPKLNEYAERTFWVEYLRTRLHVFTQKRPDLRGPLRVRADFLMPKPPKGTSGRPAAGKDAGKPLKELVRALAWVLDVFPPWDPAKAEVASFSASKTWATPGPGAEEHGGGLRLTVLELESRKRPQKPRVAARVRRRASRRPQ